MKECGTSGGSVVGADEVIQEALKKNVDLRDYSKEVKCELKKLEHEAVQDYIKEADNLANLHMQIHACDQVLQSMEVMLGNFQEDLGAISSEIQGLQEQSVLMNMKLKNRQAVRSELSQYVDELVVPEIMIRTICEGSVHEREFLEQLHELLHKIQYCKEQSFKDGKAALQMSDVLEALKIRATAKVREFLLQKISQFRKPLTNYQIPQSAMLKFRFYYEFLLANQREVALEVKETYIETASKMFFAYFKTYGSRLAKLQLDDVATKDDVIGVKEGHHKHHAKRSRATVFTLANRNVILHCLEDQLIVPHVAQERKEKFQLEALFRSLLCALVDNACREFIFLSDFFMVEGTIADELFISVLERSLEALEKCLSSLVSDSFDAIALLLCIHITTRFQMLALKRNVSVLDKFWERLLEEILWPRFSLVLRNHADSVQSVSGFVAEDTRPHYVVRRYGEFAAAIQAVNQTLPDERVGVALANLQANVESFVVHLAENSFGPSAPKDRLVFLINNYDMLMSVLGEIEEATESQNFQQLLNGASKEYIEEVLRPHFGPLMKSVSECEALLERNEIGLLGSKYGSTLPKLAQKFGQTWKRALESINSEIMRSFSNLKNGTKILQEALGQVVDFYHRFQKVVQNPSLANQLGKFDMSLINIHVLVTEVRKYKTSF